ncbi:hypothetical protein QTN25_002531 [Entamoeba marina]
MTTLKNNENISSSPHIEKIQHPSVCALHSPSPFKRSQPPLHLKTSPFVVRIQSRNVEEPLLNDEKEVCDFPLMHFNDYTPPVECRDERMENVQNLTKISVVYDGDFEELKEANESPPIELPQEIIDPMSLLFSDEQEYE